MTAAELVKEAIADQAMGLKTGAVVRVQKLTEIGLIVDQHKTDVLDALRFAYANIDWSEHAKSKLSVEKLINEIGS